MAGAIASRLYPIRSTHARSEFSHEQSYVQPPVPTAAITMVHATRLDSTRWCTVSRIDQPSGPPLKLRSSSVKPSRTIEIVRETCSQSLRGCSDARGSLIDSLQSLHHFDACSRTWD